MHVAIQLQLTLLIQDGEQAVHQSSEGIGISGMAMGLGKGCKFWRLNAVRLLEREDLLYKLSPTFSHVCTYSTQF